MKQLPIYLIVVLIFLVACQSEKEGQFITEIDYHKKDKVYEENFGYNWSIRIYDSDMYKLIDSVGSNWFCQEFDFLPIEFEYKGQRNLIPLLVSDITGSGGKLNFLIDSVNYTIYEQKGSLKTEIEFTLQVSKGGIVKRYYSHSNNCITNIIKSGLEREPQKDNPIKIVQYNEYMMSLISVDDDVEVFYTDRKLEMTNYDNYAIFKMSQKPEDIDSIPKRMVKHLLEHDDIIIKEDLLRTDTFYFNNRQYSKDDSGYVKTFNCKEYHAKTFIDFVGM